MDREILETEEIDKDLLDGFLARFEKDSFKSDKTNFEEMDAEIHCNYLFEEDEGEIPWTGQLCVEVYSDYFIARGDEPLLNEYFEHYEVRYLED